jgi:hypothetical protein
VRAGLRRDGPGRIVAAVRLTVIIDPLHLWPRATRVGGRAVDFSGRAALAAVSRVTASRPVGEVVDVVLRGPLPERTVLAITDGPFVDVALDVAMRRELVERLADALMERGIVQQVLERILAGPEVDELVTAAVESPRMAELADRVLESEGMERLVAQVLESRLVDASVARVLASEELWLVVERVAASPAVTQAISQQSVGFVDQVAEEVGERSRQVDDRLERGVRRFMRRRPAVDPAVPQGLGG